MEHSATKRLDKKPNKWSNEIDYKVTIEGNNGDFRHSQRITVVFEEENGSVIGELYLNPDQYIRLENAFRSFRGISAYKTMSLV